MLSGLLIDLDGTLLDTNMFHVELWGRALDSHGYHVAADRIFIEIGKGGDKVVPSLLGKEAEEKDGDKLRDAYMDFFKKEVKRRKVPVLPGAKQLIEAAKQRGIKVCLATSSKKEQLDLLQQSAGVDFAAIADDFTTADDAEESKPAPDIVAAAAKKLRLDPAECAMLGDTPYDATSAKHAGVITIGVTCGGHAEPTLRAAGARLVYRDCADLAADLDEAFTRASPTSFRLTRARQEEMMREALGVARDGLATGGAPIGAVICDGAGRPVARGFNRTHQTRNKTDHAEIVAFRDAAGKVPLESKDLVLVSTLEPCVMCLGAAMEAGVDTVVYALRAPADSGTGRVTPPTSPESQMPRIAGQILARESRALFEQYLHSAPPGPQKDFVRQLLALTDD